MTPWATANVRTGRENQIASLLTQRGRETYFPITTAWRRPRFKRKPMAVQTAAMPGYLFIRYDTIGNLEELRIMENFQDLLRIRATGQPALLPDSDIQWIKDNLEAPEEALRASVTRFGLFDRVRVPEGPWGGMRGVVTGIEKAKVWVDGIDFKKPVLFPVLLLSPDEV